MLAKLYIQLANFISLCLKEIKSSVHINIKTQPKLTEKRT